MRITSDRSHSKLEANGRTEKAAVLLPPNDGERSLQLRRNLLEANRVGRARLQQEKGTCSVPMARYEDQRRTAIACGSRHQQRSSSTGMPGMQDLRPVKQG
jgi:hypothetical protein